jgi:hypothetical protein
LGRQEANAPAGRCSPQAIKPTGCQLSSRGCQCLLAVAHRRETDILILRKLDSFGRALPGAVC